MNKSACNLTLLVMALLLISCASDPPPAAEPGTDATPVQGAGAPSGKDQDESPDAGLPSGRTTSPSAEQQRESIRKGSGVFVQGTGTGASSGYAEADGVTLNFEQASLPEFLRVVFESILEENYLPA